MKKELFFPFGTFFLVLVVAIVAFSYLVNAPSPTTEPTNTTDATAVFQGAGAHLTVHIEPADSNELATEKWEVLERILLIADRHDMKLSLHFSPSMASFAFEDDQRLDSVRSWEANGHELGMHHHGLSHVEWDGYTDAQFFVSNPDMRGDIDTMMNIINKLSIDGEVLVGSGTDQDTEWPEGILYATKGGSPPSADNILGPVEFESWNGTDVLVLTKAPFSVDIIKDNLTVSDVLEAIEEAQPDEYLGITITDNTISDDYDDLDYLFQEMGHLGVHTETLESLLSE